MSEPLVSVVITVHNQGTLLQRACENALAEAPGAQIIVVDDASSEDNWEIVTDYRVQYFRLGSQRGVAGSRNFGANRATGQILFFLDAGECFTSLGISRRAEYLQANPGTHLVAGERGMTFDESAPAVPCFITKDWVSERGSNQAEPLSLAFRRSFFCQLGGFNESLQSDPDLDLLSRALTQTKVPFFPTPPLP